MSSVESTIPAVQEVAAPLAMKAKGKGKGKAAKNKAKAKALALKQKKLAAKAAAAGGENDGEVPAVKKPEKKSLKTTVQDSIGDRPVEEVLAEARQKVQDADAAIVDADKASQSFDAEVETARKEMEVASAKVEEMQHKEALALEKLKAARHAMKDAKDGAGGVKNNKVSAEQTLKILELEVESRQKLEELAQARKAAQEAQEEAKRLLVESKIKEKEAIIAVKRIAAEQAEKEHEAMKSSAGQVSDDKLAQKDAKGKAKEDLKAAASEIINLEKGRIEREKQRQIKFREAAGIGKAKKNKMLALGAPVAASPAKKARVEDVD